MYITKIFVTECSNPQSMWSLGGSESWSSRLAGLRDIRDCFLDDDVIEGFAYQVILKERK